jgi:hypothetical protein
MYSATKHAVKGFTDALRMELEREAAPVSVTLIKPASVDTPFPHNAKKYTDKEPQLPPPVYSPEEVARVILHAATHCERDVYVGGAGKVMSTLNKHVPRATDWVGENFLIDQQLGDQPPRNPEGALHASGKDGEVRGDHAGHAMNSSLYTRASLHPVLTGAALAAVGVAAAFWQAKYRRPRCAVDEQRDGGGETAGANQHTSDDLPEIVKR